MCPSSIIMFCAPHRLQYPAECDKYILYDSAISIYIPASSPASVASGRKSKRESSAIFLCHLHATLYYIFLDKYLDLRREGKTCFSSAHESFCNNLNHDYDERITKRAVKYADYGHYTNCVESFIKNQSSLFLCSHCVCKDTSTYYAFEKQKANWRITNTAGLQSHWDGHVFYQPPFITFTEACIQKRFTLHETHAFLTFIRTNVLPPAHSPICWTYF